MAFTIEELRRPPSGAMYVSPERICVSADGELCDEADPRAVRLLVAKGCEIPAAEAAKYGLIADASASNNDTPGREPGAPEAADASAGEASAAEGGEGDDGQRDEEKPKPTPRLRPTPRR